jgi:gluconolactonase
MALNFVRIAADVPGAEGPVFDRAGNFFCVAPPTGSLLRLDQTGALVEHANTGGIPAGLQIDRSNCIWVADMKLGLLRVPRAGQVEPIAVEHGGASIRGCNDLAFDSEGNLYSTAPAGSSLESRVGELFCRLRTGSLNRLDSGFAFCNGIAVSADNSLLIVAETLTKSLWVYDIVAPGKVQNRRLFAKLPGEHEGGPDGIDFDAEGNLLATNWGGGAIEVFNRDGASLDRIYTPFAKPSNLHFDSAANRQLYVTEHTNDAVWKATWRCGGLERWPSTDRQKNENQRH